MQILVYFPI